jgi:hypothetical protein
MFSFQAASYWNVTLNSFANRAEIWSWTRRVPPGSLWRLRNKQVTRCHILEESKLQIHHKSYTLIDFWTPCTIPSGTNQRVLWSVGGRGHCEAIQKHLPPVNYCRLVCQFILPTRHTKYYTTCPHRYQTTDSVRWRPPFNCPQSLSKHRNKENNDAACVQNFQKSQNECFYSVFI